MEKINTPAIIVRCYQSGDNNLVVRTITPELGKFVVFAGFAKNSSKRFGRLDLFDYGEIFATQKSSTVLPKLTEFRCRSSFPNLRNTYQQIVCATLLAEITDRLTAEGDNDSKDNFSILLKFLELAAAEADARYLLKLTYEAIWRLCRISGFFEVTEAKAPSVRNLQRMINTLQEQTGKRLLSASDVYGLAKNLASKKVAGEKESKLPK